MLAPTFETTILHHRRAMSIAWAAVAVCVSISVLASLPLLGMTAWFGAIAAMIVTMNLQYALPEEQLVRPRSYRVIAGAVLAVSIAGTVMGTLPESSERSQLLAVFFGITTILAYRTLVARGPRPARLLVAVTGITWLPAALFLVVNCKCGANHSNWTEDASRGLFLALLSLLGALIAVALLAFRRRTDRLPDATVRLR